MVVARSTSRQGEVAPRVAPVAARHRTAVGAGGRRVRHAVADGATVALFSLAVSVGLTLALVLLGSMAG